jgi:polyphenol oxidase
MRSEYSLGAFDVVVTTEEVDDAVFASQVHKGEVVDVEDVTHRVTQADGIVTSQGSKPIGIYTADCLPLVLVADTKTVAIHVSRKTLVAEILNSAIHVLGSEVVHIAFLGPHACSNHLSYEYAGEELIELERKFPESVSKNESMTHVSLRAPVLKFLKREYGEKLEIVEDGRCTVEDENLFSWRRHFGSGQPMETLGRIKTVVYPKAL